MKQALGVEQSPAEQDRCISEAYEREQPRLRSFIRRRVPDAGDADDILQEVFTELVEAYRMFQTIDQVGAWLFRVARNRIVDLFRKKKPALLNDLAPLLSEEGAELSVEELLPSPEAGPDAAFARLMLVEELEAALDELPAEQREAFVAHEIEGISFKELSARTGVNINTLLTRKRLAVIYLRGRLREIYDEFARLAPQSNSKAVELKKPARSQEFKEWIRAVVSRGINSKELRHE
jgi:RNA polymerase sigma factor (sigma-70 family)